MNNFEKENKMFDLDKMTELHCPVCGKRSYTKIKWGEVIVHCKNCKNDFEVKIQIVENTEKEVRINSG